MSGQYSLTKDEENIIREIMKKHNCDFNRELSINFTSWNDESSEWEENIYIQDN